METKKEDCNETKKEIDEIAKEVQRRVAINTITMIANAALKGAELVQKRADEIQLKHPELSMDECRKRAKQSIADREKTKRK